MTDETDKRNARKQYINDVAAQIFIDAIDRDDLEAMVKLNKERGGTEISEAYNEKLKKLTSLATQAVVAGSMIHDTCASFLNFEDK